MATFDGVRHTDHEEAGMWREAQATILYEDAPGSGNLQQYAADNLVRATPSDEHLEYNYRAANGSAGGEVGSHPGSHNMGYVTSLMSPGVSGASTG